MAPSNRSSSKKTKARGVGVDFKKVKHKVGRKLLPAANATKIEVKSKAIVLPGQSVARDKDGLAINNRRQTLKELLMQTTHHNENVRREALMGIKDLLARHPKELSFHAVTLIEKLSPRITDNGKGVRQALLVLLRTSIFAGLPQAVMGPLIPVMMAYIFSAMTNLAMDIRISAFTFLDLLVQCYPSLVVAGYMAQIVQQYVEFLGKVGLVGQNGSQLPGILNGLLHFLSAIRLRISTQDMNTLGFPATEKGIPLRLQDDGRMMLALHWYKSVVPQEKLCSDVSRFDGLADQKNSAESQISAKGSGRFSIWLADSLVHGLLNCWADCAPLVCSGQAPDINSLECMVSISQALHIIILCIKPELPMVSSSDAYRQDIGTKLGNPAFDGKPIELHKWLQERAIPVLSHRLMASFPICAPPVSMPKKVGEALVALNIGVSEVMLDSILAGDVQIVKDYQQLPAILDYVEGALYGRMLPSSELSSSVTDKKLFECHVKSLIRFIPGLLCCISREWQARLLQAFTEVFQSCKASSSIKHACLSCISEILQPDHIWGGRIEKGIDVFKFQKQWLQALPRLLWELKHNHSSSSLAVLQVLHHLGRSAPEDSVLAKEYTDLQPIFIPFFSTFSPSKHHQARWLYGPFIKLPVQCQKLAIDLLYYFGSFSSAFLSAIVHCCLCPEVEVGVIVRCLEVLQKAFCRGSVKLPEHISFLITIMVGQASSPGKSFHEGSTGVSISISESGDLEKRKEKVLCFRRHIVITGVVCASLFQIGDGRVLLHLLNPSLCHQLGLHLPLEVSYGLIKVVSVLSGCRKSFYLPESVSKSLPHFVAKYLISIAMDEGLQGKGRRDESLIRLCIQPCFALLSKSDELTESVVNCLCSSSSQESVQHVYATAVALLQIFQQEHVRNKISSKCIDSSLLRSLKDDELVKLQDLEEKELKNLYEKLRRAANLAYGWQKETLDNTMK